MSIYFVSLEYIRVL